MSTPPVGPAPGPTPTEVAFDGSAYPAGAVPDTAELAQFYLHLADAEFDGYCDLYAHLSRAIAADEDFLATVVALAPATKIVPVLLFAAVHDRLLADPAHPLAAIYRDPTDLADAWPLFRALVLGELDALRAVVQHRTIQTNEVGRAAMVLPALRHVRDVLGDRPVAMVEIGPSAGLNLFVDRFRYTYTSDGTPPVVLGEVSSPVSLHCELRGTTSPPLGPPPPIAARRGIDLNPIDVLDPVACRWLEACLWPGLPERATRLRGAIGIARDDPPRLVRGNALDVLGSLVDELDPAWLPVITSTWVLAYFSKEERAAFGALLERIGSGRDLACITAEYPSVAPGIDRPDRGALDTSGQAATLLGAAVWHGGVRTARPLAWTQAHGRWIDWLG